MMKKELLNKKVVRAISLGLSAVMLTTPMTAMAAEGDPVPTDDMDTTHDTDTQAAETAIQEAQDSTTDGGSIVLEEAVILPSGDEVTVIPDADDAAGADKLNGVTTTVDEDTVDYTDVAKDEATANNALTDAEVDLIKADASEAAAAVDVTDANKITEKIEDNNDVITDASQKAADAADVAVEAAKEADEAKTKAEAQAAIDKAEQAVADAEAAQAEAQAAYEDNLTKLTDAEAELKAAEEKLAAANASLTASAEDIAAAEEAVTAAEEKATALKAEVDKEAEAVKNSKDAALKAAYEKMMAIKSISNLYDGDGFDADGVDDEFVDTFGSESAGGGYWNAADDYFELYLECVYGDKYVDGEWTRKNTLNNELNYVALRDNVFTVTYIDDNGNEATALYNYHTADTDGNISIYEKQIGKETIINTTKETSSEDALSIKNEDGTYTKYDDVKGKDDVVVNAATDEGGKATSILVKDANSQLVDRDEAELGQNQAIDNSKEESYEYTIETISVPAAYGTKEVDVDYVDRLGTYNNLKKQVEKFEEKYPAEEGYRIVIFYDEGFGNDREITLEEAKDLELGSILGSWLDCGFEVKVYQTVEDKDNVTEWAQQNVIVKTTYADVITTKENKVSDVCGDKKRAEKAAKEKAASLGLKEGEYSVIYKDVWDNPFDKDCKYTIVYNTTSSEKMAVSTEKYTGTSYEMNTITTEKTVETKVEREYWTERKDTTNDQKVMDAINGVEKLLAEMEAKQDAAAIALIAAQEAKKDVEAAKAALKNVSVDDAAYQAALARYNNASAAFDVAKASLDTINDEVIEAQDAYEDAAAELGRFIPTPSTGGDDAGDDGDDDTTGGTTPTTPVVVPVVAPEEIPTAVVTPVAGGEGAGTVVVDIEDEDTPLAAGFGDGADANGGDGEDVIFAEADEEEPAIVAIEDEETPLAPSAAEKAKMSWWWLLIIALLGATGYKMYKDHQKKKEEAAQEA